MRRILSSIITALLFAQSLSAQTLPAVGGVEWPHLRDHCRELLRSLDEAKAPLPAETARALRDLLDKEPADPESAVAAVQRLLAPHCLVGVDINPESRVKAVRGAAAADLLLGQEVVVLIRVNNEGGVTSSLVVSGPGLTVAKEKDGWLTATTSRARLSGCRLDYIVLRLTAREGGKREATLRFDVGQGTQDLGFRAEVPILFTVRTP